VAGSQASRPSHTVPLPALQAAAATVSVPAQVPPPQTSVSVQAFASSHGIVLFVKTHPRVGSHESSVHGLPSLQTSGTPGRHPPVAGSQVSRPLQASASAHTVAVPTQAPAAHVSPLVQRLPSSQVPATGVSTQPAIGSQLSAVQTLLSSQFGIGPAWQPSTGSQVSTPLQKLPSSHGVG